VQNPLPIHASVIAPPDSAHATPLESIAELRQVDEAVDYAARVTRGTVSEFLASPRPAHVDGTPAAVDLAVEFFVPPDSAEAFAAEFDRALTRRSLTYSAGRRSGQLAPARVTVIPGGTFHQWRSAWKVSACSQHEHRWSADRQMLEGLIRQAQTGWREMASIV
jgi:hypothetical protein